MIDHVLIPESVWSRSLFSILHYSRYVLHYSQFASVFHRISGSSRSKSAIKAFLWRYGHNFSLFLFCDLSPLMWYFIHIQLSPKSQILNFTSQRGGDHQNTDLMTFVHPVDSVSNSHGHRHSHIPLFPIVVPMILVVTRWWCFCTQGIGNRHITKCKESTFHWNGCDAFVGVLQVRSGVCHCGCGLVNDEIPRKRHSFWASHLSAVHGKFIAVSFSSRCLLGILRGSIGFGCKWLMQWAGPLSESRNAPFWLGDDDNDTRSMRWWLQSLYLFVPFTNSVKIKNTTLIYWSAILRSVLWMFVSFFISMLSAIL